jgi:acetyl esterase/lipase
MDQVRVNGDVVYKTVDGRELKLDVYTPADLKEGEQVPAVILVGPLEDQRSDGQYTSWARLLGASGLVGVTFSHRSEGVSVNPNTAEDVDDLVRYVRENAPTPGIDPGRLGVWAPSAGVPFGVRAALHGAPEYIRALAVYYGVMLYEGPAERAEEFSALHYLRSGQRLPPVFVAKAARDRSFINNSIDEFVDEAAKRGVPVAAMTHEEGLHAFDLVNDDDRSREIVRATLDFFTATLLRGEVPPTPSAGPAPQATERSDATLPPVESVEPFHTPALPAGAGAGPGTAQASTTPASSVPGMPNTGGHDTEPNWAVVFSLAVGGALMLALAAWLVYSDPARR